jgi:hypothetical protein
MGHWGRGATGRGGHGSSCLHRIRFFWSGVFCKGLRRGKGFRSSCRLLLGCAMGPRCACRGEAGMGRRGRGANGRGGGMGPHAFTASCSFALLSFARASGGARASDWGTGCPWGVPWGRGARVEVRRVWGVGGVLPMAAGGMGPHTFTASCSFALLSFARASGGARASGRATGCSWGVPWGRGARVEVRRWWCGATMSTRRRTRT